MKVRYVGTFDAVDLPAAALFEVERGATIEVDDDLGVRLCDQPSNWEPAGDDDRTFFACFCDLVAAAERGELRPPYFGARLKLVCARCERTLGDLIQQEGFVTVGRRLKGQQETHVVIEFGPDAPTMTRSGRAGTTRTMAAFSIVCRCGRHERLSADRARALAERAWSLRLREVRV